MSIKDQNQVKEPQVKAEIALGRSMEYLKESRSCKVCGVEYTSSLEIIPHLYREHPKCKDCKLRSLSVEDHILHRLEKHLSDIRQAFQTSYGIKKSIGLRHECSVCSAVFTRKTYALVHMAKKHPLIVSLFNSDSTF
ncbi:unnamed protein product [Blepharisma stoltei]|uniref:C2H2-type domain-containing protein n=1 Tax=Blepharisma stoltei TaxID=1481888 RepID=A0AAU9J1L4_9CILI|nr:unnamed protein product [Blepharisma stoltei]